MRARGGKKEKEKKGKGKIKERRTYKNLDAHS